MGAKKKAEPAKKPAAEDPKAAKVKAEADAKNKKGVPPVEKVSPKPFESKLIAESKFTHATQYKKAGDFLRAVIDK